MRVAADPSIQVRSVIGADSLREVVRQFIPPEVIPELKHSSYDGYLAFGDSAQLLPAFRRQAQVIGLGISAIIKRAVQENIGLIIEGVHVTPEPIRAYLSAEERRYVAEVLIDISSSAVHRERLAHRAEFAPDRDTSRQLANFERIRQIRAYLCDVAQMYHIPIVANDAPDMAEAVAACVAIYQGYR
jgi:2-phosphoglycerate kinase